MKSICKAGIIFLLGCMFNACGSPANNEATLREEIAGLKERIKHLEAAQPAQKAESGTIQHTVMFKLKHEPDAPETAKFLQDAQRILTAVPVVKNFQVLRQVSPKNEFHFFFTMEFADRAAYQAYNNHPDHVKFVKERWDTEVTEFLEADFVGLSE
jgi:quinol monooxygenase YgiN